MHGYISRHAGFHNICSNSQRLICDMALHDLVRSLLSSFLQDDSCRLIRKRERHPEPFPPWLLLFQTHVILQKQLRQHNLDDQSSVESTRTVIFQVSMLKVKCNLAYVPGERAVTPHRKLVRYSGELRLGFISILQKPRTIECVWIRIYLLVVKNIVRRYTDRCPFWDFSAIGECVWVYSLASYPIFGSISISSSTLSPNLVIENLRVSRGFNLTVSFMKLSRRGRSSRIL